tara:strand:+ start:6177 stop:6911 length:735 start_codon:yes stop_codon:yes gene_type:complete
MASITLTRDVSNETIQKFMEQNANFKKQQKKTAEQLKSEREKRTAYIEINYPKFEKYEPLIGNKINLEARIKKLQGNLRQTEENITKNIKKYYEANVSRYEMRELGEAPSTLKDYLNSQKLNFNNYYGSLEKLDKELLDDYFNTVEELYTWSSQPEIDDEFRDEYTETPAVLFDKILLSQNATGLGSGTASEKANKLMAAINWEYVESNSRIKRYKLNTVYHFKNGSFMYVGGEPTNIKSWIRQ